MLTDQGVLTIRRWDGERSNLTCLYCHSDKVTSVGQHRRVNGVFYMWWKCHSCKLCYGLTT